MARILLNYLLQVSLFLLLGTATVSAQSQIPIEGGCELGLSQAFHGLPADQAIMRIKQYANLYTRDYSGFKNQERKSRRTANQFMLLDSWEQDTVIAFTREQRQLLYISIGGELAQGRVSVDELPDYVVAIDAKINDIEAQLGCRKLAAGD